MNRFADRLDVGYMRKEEGKDDSWFDLSNWKDGVAISWETNAVEENFINPVHLSNFFACFACISYIVLIFPHFCIFTLIIL